MRIKARIALLSDFLRQQFDSIRRVAEDDGLINLKLEVVTRQPPPPSTSHQVHLAEESVEAVDFLALFDVRIVLCNASKSEFIHKVNFVRVSHMLILCHAASSHEGDAVR